MASANLQIAVSKEDKEIIDNVFKFYNFSYSYVIEKFLESVVREAGIDLHIDYYENFDQETLRAMHEPYDPKDAKNVDEFWSDLMNDKEV